VCAAWSCDDSGINAGAVTPTSVPKILGAIDIALEAQAALHSSRQRRREPAAVRRRDVGARGWRYYRRALLSAAGIPTLAVLHGLSTAGGATSPDSAITWSASRATAWPHSRLALVRATGEIADDRELGSSEMHAAVSGLVEYG
jgi:geranyl-CoA carboxylase beta subunit